MKTIITEGIIYFNLVTWILLTIFTLFQLHLLVIYLRNRKKEEEEVNKIIKENRDYQPTVTIQIPIYNELYVVERIIDCVAKLEYPEHKMEIQVLDDSTDETSKIISEKIIYWKNKGVNIEHLKRCDRTGFKAGALEEGMKKAKGELMVIFDSDFMPETDFLLKTIPFFKNKELGFLQTRWQHLNRNYSLLTKLQAFGLDAHYTIQQLGRNAAGYFSNFTGTGGVWRKECIIDSGGWKSDTLTEDLDLSYRAQLNGWKYKYLETVEAPAELPPAISALKSQQYRWTKGAVETAKKYLLDVIKSDIPFIKKAHSIFHLLYVLIFVFALISTLLSVPLFILLDSKLLYPIMYLSGVLYTICLVINTFFFWVSFSKNYDNKPDALVKFIKTLPLFTCVLMGLLLNNSVAVIEGLIGRKTAFIRTPKFNVTGKKGSWKGNKYLNTKISFITIMEGCLMIYFIGASCCSFHLDNFSFLPLHLMLAFGYGTIFYYSISHARINPN